MLMEHQVITTYSPGGRLHRTEQFERRQGCETEVSTRTLRPPYRRLVTPPVVSPVTAISRPDRRAAAAVLSPAALGMPAMTVTPKGPPQIRFSRTLRTVQQLHQLWRYWFAMMPSVDDLEMRWGSRWRLRNERQLFSMRKAIMGEIVALWMRSWHSPPPGDGRRGMRSES